MPGTHLGAVLIEGHVPNPMQAIFYAPVTLHPGGQSLRWRILVARGGDQIDDLDGFGSFIGDGAAELGDLSCAGKPIQSGTSATLIVRVIRRPWSVVVAVYAGISFHGNFLSFWCSVGMFAFAVNM